MPHVQCLHQYETLCPDGQGRANHWTMHRPLRQLIWKQLEMWRSHGTAQELHRHHPCLRINPPRRFSRPCLEHCHRLHYCTPVCHENCSSRRRCLGSCGFRCHSGCSATSDVPPWSSTPPPDDVSDSRPLSSECRQEEEEKKTSSWLPCIRKFCCGVALVATPSQCGRCYFLNTSPLFRHNVAIDAIILLAT